MKDEEGNRGLVGRRWLLALLVAAVLVLSLFAVLVVLPRLSPPISSPADLIFFNGTVVTMETEPPQAEAVAVAENHIVAVGTEAEVFALRGEQTLAVDLAGRTLLPGFIDGHTHLLINSEEAGKTLSEAMDVAVRYGVTTVSEMWMDELFLETLFQAEREGSLRLRVNAYPVYNDAILDEEGKNRLLKQWFPARGPILDQERMVRVPGIKIFADLRSCPALTEPYPEEFRNDWDLPEWNLPEACRDRGVLFLSQDEMNRVVTEAQDAGFRVAIHAMGDLGIETALNAIEFALRGESNEVHRHQIHHNSLVRPDLLPRYSDLGIAASVRGYFPTCTQNFLPEYWFGPDRFEWYYNRYALPSLPKVHAFAEGDFGWTRDPDDRTSDRPIDPLLTIYGLVTRQQLREDGTACDPEPWVARHKVTAEQALRMATVEAAYAASQDGAVGSLRPGKLADFVVLSENPLTVHPDELKDLAVQLTMVGGRAVYCEPIYGDLCSGLDEAGETSQSPPGNAERDAHPGTLPPVARFEAQPAPTTLTSIRNGEQGPIAAL